MATQAERSKVQFEELKHKERQKLNILTELIPLLWYVDNNTKFSHYSNEWENLPQGEKEYFKQNKEKFLKFHKATKEYENPTSMLQHLIKQAEVNLNVEFKDKHLYRGFLAQCILFDIFDSFAMSCMSSYKTEWKEVVAQLKPIAKQLNIADKLQKLKEEFIGSG